MSKVIHLNKVQKVNLAPQKGDPKWYTDAVKATKYVKSDSITLYDLPKDIKVGVDWARDEINAIQVGTGKGARIIPITKELLKQMRRLKI